MIDTERQWIYIHESVHGTVWVYNYSGKSEVNTFLHYFDVWGSWGEQFICSDQIHSKFRFECSKEFAAFCLTTDFKRAFLSRKERRIQ